MFDVFFVACLYFLALLTVNALGVGVFSAWSQRLGVLLDRPNSRSTHRVTTSRGAGVIFVWSTVLTWCLLELCYPQSFLPQLIAGGLLVAAISFLDDLRGMSIPSRLAVQAVAAGIFVLEIPLPDVLVDTIGPLALLWRPLAIFFIVAVTNIYNFMDGLDGLAAGHSCIVLTSWIVFGSIYSIGHFESLVCLSLLVPLVGFLLYNWHPAKAFMGDVGSTFIGFTFACLALIQLGEVPRLVNFSAYLLLMMPFLFDASFTIISRYLRGEKWYRPHRLHIFQRIYDQGVSQLLIVMVYLGITAYMGCMLLLSHLQILTNTAVGGMLCLAPYLLLYSWMWRLEQDTESAVAAESI